MDFRARIAELDFIHNKLQQERMSLDVKRQHDVAMAHQISKIKAESI